MSGLRQHPDVDHCLHALQLQPASSIPGRGMSSWLGIVQRHEPWQCAASTNWERAARNIISIRKCRTPGSTFFSRAWLLSWVPSSSSLLSLATTRNFSGLNGFPLEELNLGPMAHVLRCPETGTGVLVSVCRVACMTARVTDTVVDAIGDSNELMLQPLLTTLC